MGDVSAEFLTRRLEAARRKRLAAESDLAELLRQAAKLKEMLGEPKT